MEIYAITASDVNFQMLWKEMETLKGERRFERPLNFQNMMKILNATSAATFSRK